MTKENKVPYTSADRLIDALNHREPQGIPFDLGGTKVTGIHINAYRRIMERLFGEAPKEVPLAHFTQQLAKIDDRLLSHFEVDTAGVFTSTPAGKPPRKEQDEDYLEYWDEWSIGWKMPQGHGLYYDMFYHPLVDGQDDLDSFPWPNGRDPVRFEGVKEEALVAKEAGKAVTLGGICAGIFELGLWLRGFENFFTDLVLNPGMACGLMDRILEVKMAYWDTVLDMIGDHVLVVQEADDLGTQTSSLISLEMYRKLIKPRHKRLFQFIKEKTSGKVKIFLHSCGNIAQFIPDFIDAGVDILNPVQTSTEEMEPAKLKKAFGDAITFWGGGVDTQRILPYGSPEEVKDDVRRRIDDLAPGGGFVFATVHNIQADVPPENIIAMVEALDEYR